MNLRIVLNKAISSKWAEIESRPEFMGVTKAGVINLLAMYYISGHDKKEESDPIEAAKVFKANREIERLKAADAKRAEDDRIDKLAKEANDERRRQEEEYCEKPAVAKYVSPVVSKSEPLVSDDELDSLLGGA